MKPEPIMTGFSGLDSVLGGYRPGTLNVIGGRPLMGTTALTLNIARNAARNSGKAVVYFTLKESKAKIALRLFRSLLAESCNPGTCDSLGTLMGDASRLPVCFDDHEGFTMEYMRDRINSLLKNKIDIGLVIIDSFELIRPSDRDLGSRQKEMSEISRSLKNFAEGYGLPVVVAAHATRYADIREDHIPDLYDLNSICLADLADSVVFILRPNNYKFEKGHSKDDYDDDRAMDAKLIVAKNRYGEKDTEITIWWNRETLSYQDTDDMFPNLIVGHCNTGAFLTACSVANKPGLRIRNPFYIWGKSGMGKTLLMRSVGDAILKFHPDKKVVYATCDSFINEFLECIHKGDQINAEYKAFKDKYRNADVLLLDDVQFLKGKEGIAQELFMMIGALVRHNKQVVITGDRSPRELMSAVDTRLASLILSGAFAGIGEPDLWYRRAVFMNDFNAKKISIDDKLVDYICGNIESIPEFMKVKDIILCYCENATAYLDEDFVKKLIVSDNGGTDIACYKVIEEVSKFYKVSYKQILFYERKCSDEDKKARKVAVLICHSYLEMSYSDIRKIFSFRLNSEDLINYVDHCAKEYQIYADAIMDRLKKQKQDN